MFTAGTSPADAVRATCASKPGQSIAPSGRNGSRTADMPVIRRPGRNPGAAVRACSSAMATDLRLPGPSPEVERQGRLPVGDLDDGVVGAGGAERVVEPVRAVQRHLGAV